MRYILHPGLVTAADGDIHFVGCTELAKLYGLDPLDPNVVTSQHPGFGYQEGDIHLHPRDDGNYTLQKEGTMTEKPFWILWGTPGQLVIGGTKYDTEADAAAKAKKFAEAYPGQLFFVAEAKYGFGAVTAEKIHVSNGHPHGGAK